MKVPGKAHYKGDVTTFFEEAPRIMGPRTYDRTPIVANTWEYDKTENVTTVTFRTIDASN